MVFSGRIGLRLMTVVGLDFGWRPIVELAVKSLFVEPRHPGAGGDLKVVEILPGPAVGGEGGGVSVQLGLEQPHDRLGHGIVEAVADGADGRGRHRPRRSGRCRGSRCTAQYLSDRFRALCGGDKIRQSAGRVATCFANPVAESFWSSLKRELVHRYRFATRVDATAAITAWIKRYNNVCRLHSTLGYVPLVEWELHYRLTQLQAA